MMMKASEREGTMSHAVDEPLYEVIDGQRVELPPMGIYQTLLANSLMFYVEMFAKPKKLGRTVVEGLFDLAPVGRERRPDVAFVSSARWAWGRLPPLADNAWSVIPNLAVEVVSPLNTASEIQTKIHEYFRSGVELVWVIYPEHQEVYVYESPIKPHVLTRSDVLDGGKVLPGFQLALAELFGDESVLSEHK
jgi:Uma2 family endonuclease